MPGRSFFRITILVMLLLQVLSPAAEAATCKTRPAEPGHACPSLNKAGATAFTSLADGTGSTAPASQDSGDDHSPLCPFCPGPCVEAAQVPPIPADQIRRFVPADVVMFYEAPSSTLYRPPIA